MEFCECFSAGSFSPPNKGTTIYLYGEGTLFKKKIAKF
jgi:hypothetical protein